MKAKGVLQIEGIENLETVATARKLTSIMDLMSNAASRILKFELMDAVTAFLNDDSKITYTWSRQVDSRKEVPHSQCAR